MTAPLLKVWIVVETGDLKSADLQQAVCNGLITLESEALKLVEFDIVHTGHPRAVATSWLRYTGWPKVKLSG